MPQELFTVAQLRLLEQAHERALAPGTLMQRAGLGAADWIHQRYGARPLSIVVLCGPGNNGGDGYVCAAELLARGHRASCVALQPPRTPDASAAAARFAAAGGATQPTLPDVVPDLVVDALFGIGLQRPVATGFSEQVHWVEAARARGVPVVALDVPTGLDADRGSWVGDVPGVHADATLTFLGAKPGLYTGNGLEAAGDVVVDDLQVGATPASDGRLNGPAEFQTLIRPRARGSHKGSFGNVAIVGGNTGMVGAALLAARAALRLGAGRVYVDCIGAPELRVDPLQPELMFRDALEPELLGDMSALVVGCGIGTNATAANALHAALAAHCALVLDADALNLLAATEALQRRLVEHAAHPRILTPHPLEAARLLGATTSDVQRDRIGAARRLAQRFGAWVVLKGAGSVVTDSAGAYWINTSGTPALATAGTGDVLAGMLGALLAQGLDPRTAVLGGVWLHGRAAQLHAGDVGLTAGEVAALAARALNGLRSGASRD